MPQNVFSIYKIKQAQNLLKFSHHFFSQTILKSNFHFLTKKLQFLDFQKILIGELSNLAHFIEIALGIYGKQTYILGINVNLIDIQLNLNYWAIVVIM